MLKCSLYACLITLVLSVMAWATHPTYVVVEDGLSSVAVFKDSYVVNVCVGKETSLKRDLKVGDIVSVAKNVHGCRVYWSKMKVVCVVCTGKTHLAFLEDV